jgi:tRNA/tmRNA/rRNA uracil-C5-methylase (TrmA/RlmC/RlmD family)
LENNKGRVENRAIRTAQVGAEDVGFPFAAQAARLLRQTQGRADEQVALITSALPQRLKAQQWLQLNRQSWDIESGLHQRLDVSYNDDRCRVQNPKTMLILGMYRRLANSLFMEWRQHQPRPEHLTTTDFQTRMTEEHCFKALRFLLAKRPSLKSLS